MNRAIRVIHSKYFLGSLCVCGGFIIQALVQVVGRSVKAGSDPDIGLGLLVLAGLAISFIGLVLLAIRFKGLWKAIPIIILVLYLGSLSFRWVKDEMHSNAIYHEEQVRRTENR